MLKWGFYLKPISSNNISFDKLLQQYISSRLNLCFWEKFEEVRTMFGAFYSPFMRDTKVIMCISCMVECKRREEYCSDWAAFEHAIKTEICFPLNSSLQSLIILKIIPWIVGKYRKSIPIGFFVYMKQNYVIL